MNAFTMYFKHDLNQLFKRKSIKIYYGVLTTLILIDIMISHSSAIHFEFMEFKASAFNYLFLENSDGFLKNLYFFIMPIIASFAFSTQYYIEKKNNFHINLIVRGNRWSYLLSKFTINYIVGFFTIFYILILNYGIVLLTYQHSFVLGDNVIPPDNGSAFENIFYANAYLYQFVYIIINALIGGMFSVLAFSLTLLIKYKNKFMVIAVPFIIYIMSSIYIYCIDFHYDLLHIIQPITRFALTIPITNTHVIYAISTWYIITLVIFYIGYKREKDLL
ncbi:hypothetical protein [Anaerophilus nitritogenes]|uniref:hypothetical protein n=1 Tax=Anaerophilus nitritogenes TaxID=2498136 RepID=UPI00101C3922|nr:hypothetical protein [Anaerophilus nitritogenes]